MMPADTTKYLEDRGILNCASVSRTIVSQLVCVNTRVVTACYMGHISAAGIRLPDTNEMLS